jgi:hypothetical protein
LQHAGIFGPNGRPGRFVRVAGTLLAKPTAFAVSLLIEIDIFVL